MRASCERAAQPLDPYHIKYYMIMKINMRLVLGSTVRVLAVYRNTVSRNTIGTYL